MNEVEGIENVVLLRRREKYFAHPGGGGVAATPEIVPLAGGASLVAGPVSMAA